MWIRYLYNLTSQEPLYLSLPNQARNSIMPETIEEGRVVHCTKEKITHLAEIRIEFIEERKRSDKILRRY